MSETTTTRLTPPDRRPNSVYSRASGSDRNVIAPYPGGADPVATFARLKEVVRAMPRVEVTSDEPTYFAWISRSRIFRFPDECEAELDGDQIHFKFQARMGIRDFDVNRKRAEEIRGLLGV